MDAVRDGFLCSSWAVAIVVNGRQQHADSVSVLQQSNRFEDQIGLLLVILLLGKIFKLYYNNKMSDKEEEEIKDNIPCVQVISNSKYYSLLIISLLTFFVIFVFFGGLIYIFFKSRKKAKSFLSSIKDNAKHFVDKARSLGE